MKTLSGKTCLITGAAGGLGQAFVAEALAHKMHVVATDIDERVTSLWSSKQVTGTRLDVTSMKQWHHLLHHLKTNDSLPHIWIFNAGMAHIGEYAKAKPELIDKTIQVNVLGVMNGYHAALNAIAPQHEGVFVTIASALGHAPLPLHATYAASKHALVGFTRSVELELRYLKHKQRTLIVSPGSTDTAIMWTNFDELEPPDALKWAIAQPAEVARATFAAIKQQKREITLTPTGKTIRTLYEYCPTPLYDMFSTWLTGAARKK